MLNRVVLTGRMVADPELKYTGSGIAVSNFSIAVNRTFKNQQGERETDFINIVAWRKTAELVGQYSGKGKLVGVDGRLQVRHYQTDDGQKRTVYEVVAESIQFLEFKSRDGGGGSSPAPTVPEEAPPEQGASNQTADDLPF